jgi:hypothetical protein
MTKSNGNGRGRRLPAFTGETVQMVVVEKETAIEGVSSEIIRKRLIELKTLVESSYLEMGKLLNEVKTKLTKSGKPLWSEWKFSSFNEYCERELGFKERKGFHLLSVYRNTVEGVLPQKEMEEIGWAKASILAPLATKGIIDEHNAEKWAASAKSKSFDELSAMAKSAERRSEEKAADSGKKTVAPEEIHILRVGFFKDQWENVQTALNKAKIITGSDKQPWLLDCICMAFNSEGFNTKTEALDEMCRRVERAYGVKIIAIDSGEDQVVFGDALVKMMKAMEKKEKK